MDWLSGPSSYNIVLFSKGYLLRIYFPGTVSISEWALLIYQNSKVLEKEINLPLQVKIMKIII